MSKRWFCTACQKAVFTADENDSQSCPVCAAPLVPDLEVDVQGVAARPRTILIVDDEPDLRHVLGLLFEVEEFTIVGETATGREAVELARKHRPGYVLLDYRMPGMDGAEAAGLIRAVAPDAQIVAFSAYLEGTPAWADGYLNKDRISEVAPLLSSLIAAAETGAATPS